MKISLLYNALALSLLVGSAYIGAIVTSSSSSEGPSITDVVSGPHPTPGITGDVTSTSGSSSPTTPTALGGGKVGSNTFIDRTSLVTFDAPFNMFQFKAMSHSDNPTVGYFALHIPFRAFNKEQTDPNLILAGTIAPASASSTSGTYYLYVHKDDLGKVISPSITGASASTTDAADLQSALSSLKAGSSYHPIVEHGHLPVLKPGITGTTAASTSGSAS